MPKRKRSDLATASIETDSLPPPLLNGAAARRAPQKKPAPAALNPGKGSAVIDGTSALRASPDSDVNDDVLPVKLEDQDRSSSSGLSEPPELEPPPPKKRQVKEKKAVEPKTENKTDFAIEAMINKKKLTATPKSAKADDEMRDDPEADIDEDADPEEIKQALSRPPPVHSDYLPLPWKGRLGYACLCTYLRNSNPPVFQSRTTRIAQILEHRHPLRDPTQPEHPVKNRPDKDKPADVRLGQIHIENLCLANCKDMIKMLRWNDKYNIKFLRLSSEAFPFASHAEYGYKLAPFASEALAEVGKVVAELGHRVSTHPGQFTQLGSPRKTVIENAIRDLEYHDEMLSLLKLPEQQDRDAVMVLHMGGTFGDKAATLDRFRDNYARLSPSIKRRLVLENDDVCWGVHDLLPICQELNIPMVLDFHHNNIYFDSSKIREGTKDIIDLFPVIRETWTRKGITQKMHHSEPTPAALTPKQRRKHNPRPATLPPCPPDMDLMVEAKDKEQAVFELMKTFKLPGYDTFNDIIPHVRNDDNKPIRPVRAKKATPKKKAAKKGKEDDNDDDNDMEVDAEQAGPAQVPEEEVGMGGPEGRVYWPPGMEEWLRPVKRVVAKKDPDAAPASAKKGKAAAATPKKATAAAVKAEAEDGEEDTAASVNGDAAAPTPSKPNAKAKAKPQPKAQPKSKPVAKTTAATAAPSKKSKQAPARKRKAATPSSESAQESSVEEQEDDDANVDTMTDAEIKDRMKAAEDEMPARMKRNAVKGGGGASGGPVGFGRGAARAFGNRRRIGGRVVSYWEEEEEDGESEEEEE